MFTLQQIESWITQTFNPAIGEYGQDYAVPVGTPVYSPVAGTIGTQDLGKQAWGKRVFVNVTDPLVKAAGIAQFAIGHLTSFAVSPGQTVQPGQLLGYSGGATSDPSSGDSTGPHVEPQFLSKSGAPLSITGVFAKFSGFESAIFNGGAPKATTSSSSSSSSNGLANLSFPGGSLNVPDPFASAGGLAGVLGRGFAFLIAIPIVVIGLFLIVSGDLEKLGERAADAVEKVAPAAVAA